jgi:hypothetical protein
VTQANRSSALALSALVLASGGALAAGLTSSGCGPGTSGATATSAAPADAAARPTVRLVLLSTLAGALEPCGCSKDQLGGADHFAAYLASQRASAEGLAVLGAGPLFFQEPRLEGDKVTQDGWKAESLAAALAKIGLVAWAPGANDWAAGADTFAKLRAASGATFVAANLTGDTGLVPSRVVEAGGLKLGVVGLSEPKHLGALPAGVTTTAPLEPLKREVAKLRAEGARVIVALAALPRGDALRLVDEVPELDVLVLGKPSEKGDANDTPKPTVLVGDTIVVEAANHLQTAGVLDLHVREPAGSAGRVRFADAGGLARQEQLLSLAQQIRDLEHRINGWESGRSVRSDDLANRKAELARLRSERERLEATTTAPPTGSYFKVGNLEVRDRLGQDAAVADVVLGYYKRVNEHNKVAFADRRPPAPAEGEASYLGVEACSGCHAEERAVWDKTAHAHAYATLEKQFVEFNLDCVGCHVTGYEKPGGSTVAAVEKLRNVQCETCHGPGSLHAADPSKKGLVVTRPDPKSCVSACHHPPHVEGFDATAKMVQVLGPGHGL